MKSLILVACVATASLASASLAIGSNRAPSRHPGEVLYERWCSGCHDPAVPNKIGRLGPSIPAGTLVLSERYGKDIPAPLEQRTDLTPELIETVVRNGAGFMPFFRKTELSDAELKQLADYLSKNKTALINRSKAGGAGQ